MLMQLKQLNVVAWMCEASIPVLCVIRFQLFFLYQNSPLCCSMLQTAISYHIIQIYYIITYTLVCSTNTFLHFILLVIYIAVNESEILLIHKK